MVLLVRCVGVGGDDGVDVVGCGGAGLVVGAVGCDVVVGNVVVVVVVVAASVSTHATRSIGPLPACNEYVQN